MPHSTDFAYGTEEVYAVERSKQAAKERHKRMLF